ncbi:MMPL family transporter [Nakamurella silvestris]|nr:MMPL family transporter [Nakamurella silvestris]
MAHLLFRLGLGAYKRRVATILVWLFVLVGAGVGAATLSGDTSDTLSIPGRESTSAMDVITEKFGAGERDFATAQVVVRAPEGQNLTTVDNRSSVEELVAQLAALPGVAAAGNPLDDAAPTLSADRTTAYSTVTYSLPATDLTDRQHEEFNDTLDSTRARGLTVEATGSAVVDKAHGASAEVVGVVVALVVLLITFGGLAVAGMNLLTALIGVAVGFAGIFIATGFMELSSTTPVLALMLGLAVGIDYALFIIVRFRQELRKGQDVATAVAIANGTAGSAVVTAGLTVVIALAGLSVVGIGFLTQMGLGAAFTVVIAVLVATTLLPAVLGVLGRKALPRRERHAIPAPGGAAEVTGRTGPARRDRSTGHTDRGFFRGWIDRVVRRPLAALLLAVVGLGTLSVPVLSMDTALVANPSPSTTQGRAQLLLGEAYGDGVNGPLTVLFVGPSAAEAAGAEIASVKALPDVASVGSVTPNHDGTAALFSVVPRSGPSTNATEDLVVTLRTALADSSAHAYVTGSTAVSVDVSDALNDALPIYLVLVVGLALILLILVFRSLWVPLVAVLGFLLTLGAALGSSVAVFQWGWFKDLVGLDTTGPILSIVPILAIGILFGLAMDYQIFLVSRIHEAHGRGTSARGAIRSGFHSAAPVVVAAATIMFAVFAAFMPGGDGTIKLIGFVLAAGVLVDAFVVRMVLVPATLALLGDRAWTLPRWLEWLPRLDVEGSAVTAGPASDVEVPTAAKA